MKVSIEVPKQFQDIPLGIQVKLLKKTKAFFLKELENSFSKKIILPERKAGNSS